MKSSSQHRSFEQVRHAACRAQERAHIDPGATEAPRTIANGARADDQQNQADPIGRRPIRPHIVVGLGLLLFGAVWLCQLAYTGLVAPTDNIEQLNWVRSLEWGYYKHPPLPTWLIWPLTQLLGLSAATSYVTGAMVTLGTMGLLWRLLATLRGTNHACIALLAALCITYYNGRLHYYNHNIVLLLWSTASAVLCWQAFAKRQLRWWLGIGLTVGLGALTKYQIAVTVASILAFAAYQRAWRDPVHRLGALLACSVALLLFVPHFEWLRTHNFGPIRYALDSSLGAGISGAAQATRIVTWLADQVFNRALPAWLLLIVVALPHWRAWIVAGRAMTAPTAPNNPRRALLLAWGVLPLVFMPLVALLSGAELQLQWGTPYLLFAVPAAMEMAPRHYWDRIDLRRAFFAFLVIQALLLALNFVTSARGPIALRDRHLRPFDPAALAEDIAPAARAALGGPIVLVIGEGAQAGALALQLPERPLVLIDGRFDRSPWVGHDLLRRCGAVQLDSKHALVGGMPVGAAHPGMQWRVIAPDAGTASCPY